MCLRCKIEQSGFVFFASSADQTQNVSVLGVQHHNGGLGLDHAGAGTDDLINDVGVGKYLLQHLLHFGVHGCHNAEAAGIEHLLTHIVVHLIAFHQQFDGVLDHGVHIPGVYAGGRTGRFPRIVIGILRLLRVINGQFGIVGRIEFGFCDFSLLQHILQNAVSSDDVVFRMELGVPLGRILGDGGNRRTLQQVQFLHRLAEVGIGGRLDSETALREINGVQIHFQNLLFAVILLQIQGLKDLADLPLGSVVVISGCIFNQLLGQSGASSGAVAEGIIDRCLDRAQPVHAVMVIEPLVLCGNIGVNQILGNVFIVHIHPVLRHIELLILQFAQVAHPVIHKNLRSPLLL